MKYSILLAFLAFCSCSSNNCDSPIENVDYNISDESAEYLSLYEGKSKALYIDSSGASVNFEIRNFFDEIEEYEFAIPCEEELGETQLQTGEKQFIEVEIYNPMFEKAFALNISQSINSTRAESMTISFGNYRLNLAESEILRGLEIPFENIPNASIDSVTIFEKTYYNVIEGGSASGDMKIKYNKQFGLFYIKNEMLNLELVLDRIE